MMLKWPDLVTPPATLPTIPQLAAIPADYYALVATGQWPRRYFFPTPEPTSDAIDGAVIHAFATTGPRLEAPLPANLVPFAKTDARYFCFDLAQNPPSIRYIDTEVDQWLTLAPDWPSFWGQLIWRSPELDEAPSPQAFGHAALVADEAALPAVLSYARMNLPADDYGGWLVYFSRQAKLACSAPFKEELQFARDYRWRQFDAEIRSALPSS